MKNMAMMMGIDRIYLKQNNIQSIIYTNKNQKPYNIIVYYQECCKQQSNVWVIYSNNYMYIWIEFYLLNTSNDYWIKIIIINMMNYQPMSSQSLEQQLIYIARKPQRGMHWNLQERRSYCVFLCLTFHLLPINGENRTLGKLYLLMSDFIGTRSRQQCRTHYKSNIKHKSIKKKKQCSEIVREIIQAEGFQNQNEIIKLTNKLIKKMLNQALKKPNDFKFKNNLKKIYSCYQQLNNNLNKIFNPKALIQQILQQYNQSDCSDHNQYIILNDSQNRLKNQTIKLQSIKQQSNQFNKQLINSKQDQQSYQNQIQTKNYKKNNIMQIISNQIFSKQQFQTPFQTQNKHINIYQKKK